MIILRFPEGRKKVLTLSYDDGTVYDLRMCEILNKYGLKCTFNINGGSIAQAKKGGYTLTFDEAKSAYKSGGHEVACHGYLHEYLKRLPASQTVYSVIRDREVLEKNFGTMVRGFAYPCSAYDDNVVDALKACGIVYARGGNASLDFSLPTDFMRIRPTVRHNNPQLMELARKFIEQNVTYEPIMFFMMGHSYEFNNNDNWNVLEEFAEYMGKRDDIWYATNIELYDYVEAYGRLVWSADMSSVYNPTLIKVWMGYDGRICSVAPGETAVLRT